MAEQSGFMAIQPPVPQGPYARRKIVRGPDGTPQVILVDMQGNTISDPSSYGIIDTGNYLDPGSLQTATIKTNDPKPESEKSTARSVISQTTKGEGGRGGEPSPGSGNFGRSQANNFGYVNKPGFVGLAGAIPGPAGMIGKAVNVGINANNVAAVNSARGMLGLDGVGIAGAVKGAVKDNKGYVADVTFSGSNYATPVGLEATTPSGMTNMTPHEASLRAAALGGLTVSTPEQVQARDDAFNAEFGKPGLLGRMTDVATSFLDNMFSPTPSYQQYDNAAHAKIAAANSGANFNPTPSGFADMLGASKKDNKTSQKAGASRSGGQDSSGRGYGGPGGASTAAGNSMGHGGIGSA